MVDINAIIISNSLYGLIATIQLNLNKIINYN